MKLDAKQLSTAEVNFTRAVTKVRGVVERVFGRLKKWQILSNTISTQLFPYLSKIMRVLGAINNKFYDKLNHDTLQNLQDAENIIRKLNENNNPCNNYIKGKFF